MSEEGGWRSTAKGLRETPNSPEIRPIGDVPEIYEFGPFRLEPAERKLLCGSAVVTLTPKAFDTLHLLVRNSGHLLEKDELVRMLWPNSFVEDGNLTNNIFLLRKALGQDPEYIETIPKKGYRFVGAVRRLPTAELVRPDKPDSRQNGFEAKAANVVPHAAAPSAREQVSTSSRAKRALITTVALGTFGALAYIALNKAWISKHQVSSPTTPTAPASVAPAAFAPPPHSIAVLPFVNISGDKEQEYFSDGLTEELLNSLSRINELQVAARTSSFYFKGKDVDLPTIAHKLNVASVLEGSVRRAGNTIRISVQLNDAVTGFHLWSQTYDRELRDVLKMQSEISNAVASALKVTLLGDAAVRIDVGGTRNPAAFDAYLKGSQAFRRSHEAKGLETAIAAYSDAIQMDPTFALAYVGRAKALDELASWWAEDMEVPTERYAHVGMDAHKAIALAPGLGEAHLVLANSLASQLDFTRASGEYERALALAPGSALVLQHYGLFAVLMGRTEQGLSASRRAVLLDPLDPKTRLSLMDALINARRPEEAIVALHEALALGPTFRLDQWVPYYMLGNYESARIMCESNPISSDYCLAEIYDKLGRRAEAESALEKYKAVNPQNWYEPAEVYAQWGDTAKALTSLKAALRSRDGALVYLKTWPLLDPVRKDPRFQAIERELKFPN
jgi:TolB-like protein/DNA-binding winged helix-turn-helix (wHTH) protein